MKKKIAARLVLAFLVLALNACIGIDAELDIKANGSGVLELDYRLSRLVEALARVAKEGQFPLPVERKDFDRTVARVAGLSVKAYSVKEDEKDIYIHVELGFSTMSALTAFLDGTGRSGRASPNGRGLSIELVQGGERLDEELVSLMRTLFDGYAVSISIKTPAQPKSSPPGSVDGSMALFSLPVMDLVASNEPIIWDVEW